VCDVVFPRFNTRPSRGVPSAWPRCRRLVSRLLSALAANPRQQSVGRQVYCKVARVSIPSEVREEGEMRRLATRRSPAPLPSPPQRHRLRIGPPRGTRNEEASRSKSCVAMVIVMPHVPSEYDSRYSWLKTAPFGSPGWATSHADSASASARRSFAPSPCHALPCMHASVAGFVEASRSSITRAFFVCEK
jgi:hypothetical protein